MSHGYFTVSKEIENVIVIERSKFICSIQGIVDEADAKTYIETIRKKYSLANHNCYAYIADDKGLVQKFSDDGEPQGTAGLPMLEVLKNKKMFKTVAVVTRFFGGIKLGTGGLTRAYGGSVSEGLSKAEIVDMQRSTFCFIETEYEWYSKLLKVLANSNVSIIDTDFSNSIKIDFAVKEDFFNSLSEKITDFFNGKLTIIKKESGYFAFK